MSGRAVPVLFVLAAASLSQGQDRLARFPSAKGAGESRSQLGKEWPNRTVATRWVEGGKLAWRSGDQWMLLDPKNGKSEKADSVPDEVTQARQGGGRRAPGRGGQYDTAVHPDGVTKAVFREGNVFLESTDMEPIPLTVSGGMDGVKFGQASWVYGEELGQNEAMGFSPEGRFLWFYRFDESRVVPTYIMHGQAGYSAGARVQLFPKPGFPNPEVGLEVYDTTTGKTAAVATSSGTNSPETGHYVYDVSWSPDGKELVFRRTDRRQRTMEVCAADPATGSVRVIVSESSPSTYSENKLGFTWLETLPGGEAWKGKVLYEHERNGYLNLGVLDAKTGSLSPVTENQVDFLRIVRIDLAGRRVFYMAAAEDNGAKGQLYVVNMDGTGNRRLTDPRFNHRVDLSPDGAYFVDTFQATDAPPAVSLRSLEGKEVAVLLPPLPKAAGEFPWPERVTFTAADGKTLLHGTLFKPRNFDPSRKYPLIVDVYGGPLDAHGSSHSETFRRPPDEVHYGFLVATFENRGTGARGKAFRDATYGKLGIVDMDDQAAGVRELAKLPYVDAKKIGVNGTSYGGYASLMLLLRYPDLYAAASASSCVNDWRNYDTIYTERYMGLLEENKAGYDAGSALTYADRLQGWLMLYYGTADDNTHPENTLNMVRKFSQLGKSIEVQVGTDAGHSGLNQQRMMEFFLERMVGEAPG